MVVSAGQVFGRPQRRREAWTLRRFLESLLLSALALAAAPQSAPPLEPELRSDILAAQQKEKAASVKPPQMDKVETYWRKAEAFLLTPKGLFPYFASIYYGDGAPLGAGYRQFYGDNTSWTVRGLYSFRNYKLIEAGTESKDHFRKRVSFDAWLGWRDATQVGFYGLGPQSRLEDRADFRFQQTYAAGRVAFRPVPWLRIDGELGVEHIRTKQGQGGYPSIESRYNASTAPGLGSNPTYFHSKVSAAFDSRPAPGYTNRGGLLQATFHDYRNKGGPYSFQMLDGEAIHHLPLYRETWVLALRGRAVTTLNDNNLIPYFMLPTLGSGSTLRAFEAARFRDRHSLLLTGEFRWLANTAVDMAFFYDAGKVAPRRNGLNFKQMSSDIGIGVRFHSMVATPVRLDLAISNEGWTLVFSSGPIF